MINDFEWHLRVVSLSATAVLARETWCTRMR